MLELDAKPLDSRVPVLCMDEQPVQLPEQTRAPVPATKQHPKRIDHECERAGTASIFMFGEPLASWRQVTVQPQRTKVDWAEEVAAFLTGRYAQAEKLILVLDELPSALAFIEAHLLIDVQAFVLRLRRDAEAMRGTR